MWDQVQYAEPREKLIRDLIFNPNSYPTLTLP